MPTFKAFKKNCGKKSRRKKTKTCLFFDKYIGKLNYENSEKQKGGKAIMYGSIGCVFSPAISCKTKKLSDSEKKRYISKLMLHDEAKREIEKVNIIKNRLTILKPRYRKYLPILSTYLCNEPDITKSDLENIEICKNVKGMQNIKKYDVKLFKHFSILNMLNSGEDLFEYRKKNSLSRTSSTKLVNNFLSKCIDFFVECIFVLNKNNIYHFDIKIENITYNKRENCLSLIDFGRAIISNNESIKQNGIQNVAFDFNILPQILLLYDDTPFFECELEMQEYIKTKYDNSINGEIALNEYSIILRINKNNIIRIFARILYKIYINYRLDLIENKNAYFHDIFKWNVDIWSMILVLNTMFSETVYSNDIKNIAKDFFEKSFQKKVDYDTIQNQLNALIKK